MKWEKVGLVHRPEGDRPWARHTALQPTPLILDQNRVRIYFGTRDDAGVSRVSYVEVDPRAPTRILAQADAPALDIGEPGMFDDNGVVPCAAVRREDGIYLYYAGYQIPARAKFLVFGGLAVSTDGGHRFERVGATPIVDRTPDEPLFRVIHSVLPDADGWRAWYGGGGTWVREGEKTLPVYDVRHIRSSDGRTFGSHGDVCVTFDHPDEYRIGRPFVFFAEGKYRMFYGTARLNRGYRLGYAESLDGDHWTRLDDTVGIEVSPEGWDGNMIAYPSVVLLEGSGAVMFYNGNDMGRDGFGAATLIHW